MTLSTDGLCHLQNLSIFSVCHSVSQFFITNTWINHAFRYIFILLHIHMWTFSDFDIVYSYNKMPCLPRNRCACLNHLFETDLDLNRYWLVTILINSLTAKRSNYFYDCLTWFSAISFNRIIFLLEYIQNVCTISPKLISGSSIITNHCIPTFIVPIAT